MERVLLDKIIQVFTYQKKPGRDTSYSKLDGSELLPNRLGILVGSRMLSTKKTGRQIHKVAVGTIQGNFTQKESSPYKQFKPFSIRTTIWQSENYPQFVGWGTIGITGANGKISSSTDLGDLIAVYADDLSYDLMKIFILPGMGQNPDTLETGLGYIATLI